MQDDAWFDSEARTRAGMVEELQRIKIRARARPLPILALALLITGVLIYKVATKPQLVEAEVVLLLTDGSLSRRETPIPVEELKEYVSNVLLPDDKLLALIERKDLYRLRKTQGDQFALDGLREQVEIEVWKNSYVYYDPDISTAEHSARIGITVTDTDPDLAFELARDLATIVVTTLDEKNKAVTTVLANDVAAFRTGQQARLDGLQREQAEEEAALADAVRTNKPGVAAALELVLDRARADEKRIQESLANIATSSDAVADKIAEAGLDTTISIVEEHRPDRPEHKSFVLMMVIAVVGFGSLFGAALLVGAFDSRIHDVDDVTRLGLPVIGHVPSFPGDKVGSLRARGIVRGRMSRFVIAGLVLLVACGPLGVILLVIGYRESQHSLGAIRGSSLAIAGIFAWCACALAALVLAGRG